MRRLIDRLMDLDARAWRALVVGFVLFGGVGLVLLFGASALGISAEATVERWLGFAASSPFGLLIAIAAFAALAFIGAPQFLLIAAAVVAFGPVKGCLYSWVGTEVSALVGFWFGRTFGSKALAALQGPALDRFMHLVGRNGFLASLVVRVVPSAPFIVVNMAAGVTPMRVLHFAAGTGVGIIPKIVLTAFAGHSVAEALRGRGPQHVAIIALVVAAWIGVGWLAGRWLKARDNG